MYPASCRVYILFLVTCYLPMRFLSRAQDAPDQFTYNGFLQANLSLDGIAKVLPNGLLQLTNTSKQQAGHAFYKLPIKFNTSLSLAKPYSFSTSFIFAMVPELPSISGHGLTFVISPSVDFKQAVASQFLGLFNSSSNGMPSNHVVAVEFDTIKSPEFDDINDNHAGIDVNSLMSNVSAPVMYYSNEEGINKSLNLISGDLVEVWIDYDGVGKIFQVTLAPISSPKPDSPLLSTSMDLSMILLDSMYVGFSSATGAIASNHYILGWSFSRGGEAQSLELEALPALPKPRKSDNKRGPHVIVPVILLSAVLVAMILVLHRLRRKKYQDLQEDWEQEYGPQRFRFKDLYKATQGFNDRFLLGSGGFGKVYRGILPSSKAEVAVKKISHDSTQGMREFVAEIASMGRLRHRNLVQLQGYCRRKGELLLVYDYMPNGSLDKFLFSNKKSNLSWAQRFHIIRGIASGLLYLHEEWEQVVLHRDIKASNILLDTELNGRLGDFGLARLYDHGANPQTTHVVGTIGYLAPELTKLGKATTSTDVFAFGAFLLEMACGRRPVELSGLPEEIILVDWVLESWRQGAILQTSDPRLEGCYIPEQVELVLKLGLLSSHSKPEARPSMRQVMQYLDGVATLQEVKLEDAGIESAQFGDEFSGGYVTSFPSSAGKISARSELSSESILRIGR